MADRDPDDTTSPAAVHNLAIKAAIAQTRAALAAALPAELMAAIPDAVLYDLAELIFAMRAFRRARGQPVRRHHTPMQLAAAAFLRALDDEEAAIDATLPPGTPAEVRRYVFAPRLDAIARARTATAPLAAHASGFNEASEMGDRIRAVFCAAGLPVPERPDDNAPITKATTALLALGGLHRAPATVAERLRRRAARPR